MGRDRQRAGSAALKASRDAFKKLDEDRARFQRIGLGPGESYIGLWRLCADYLEAREIIRKRLASEALKGRARQAQLDEHNRLQEMIRDLLQRLLPFERPRLQAIAVTGDLLHPERVKPDLTKLTDTELKQLEKIVLKVGGATTGPEEVDGEMKK
jgi:hypothetical protein